MPIPYPIVACARSWAGTRFHHQGRLKKTATHGGGVDCLGLLVGVARELALKDRQGRLLFQHDEPDYSHYPDTEKLRRKLAALLTEIPQAEMQLGDILLLDTAGSPQHLAIVTDYADGIGIIHAYAQARKVVEHALDEYWQGKIVQVYRVK